jgi:hypothetical protein
MGTTELTELASIIGLSPDDAGVEVIGGSGGLVCHALDVDPHSFLLRAETDLESGGESSELNALTNARRAIVGQMDQALLTFGYPSTRWNVPKKIAALHALGIVAPRILRRVSTARNVLEHEYRRPNQQEVEDAVDLAYLFVAAVKPMLNAFEDEIVIGNRSESVGHRWFKRCLSFGISMKDGAAVFAVDAHLGCTAEDAGYIRTSVAQTEVDWTDDAFPLIVRLAIAAGSGYRVTKAMAAFCTTLCRPTGTLQLTRASLRSGPRS